MAKLLASDVAVWLTQEGQLLHGGWGYAEETPISRYVVDAQVLPIFEGVRPILALKVIARQLLSSTQSLSEKSPMPPLDSRMGDKPWRV
jgi:(2S)-methylsuccinyl-CoA dehydrogenase